ncbi:glutathione S-transferase [Rhodococcus sp. ACPA4]|uniref:glutathione S-transferase family protein n=1 Tax=Rhodococcus sp. ACPA4 TaxID=2028571 RepID=UPI000BB0F6FD|nr:glutathione S-transferase N-terminal domain-containing protein [Rhodococcus sp. ACPA4]PBC36107.1 glutathione S-transferase [Rhodococcus sp. ACPA4]
MIDLYYYTSPNVRKILIALEELSLEYRIIWTDIKEGDQFAPEYLEINPNGKVPAIVDHDGPTGAPISVFETGAILLYLAEKTGRLLPQDPTARQEAICWLFWQVANHGPMAGQAAHFVSHAPKHGIDNPYARSRYTGEVARLYKVLDERLRDRDYLAGEYSIADISTYTWSRVAAGHGVSVSDYPNVQAWSDRIAARPASKVKVSDPREEAARKNVYNAEQFQRLFRPEGCQR